MKTKYPYDQLQSVGDSVEFTSDKPLLHVQEAFRQHGKRHGKKYKVKLANLRYLWEGDEIIGRELVAERVA